MLVAYPDENVDTELEFEYWVSDFEDDVVQRLEDLNFAGKDGKTILALLILVFVFIILLFCCLAYFISKKCCTPPELTRIEILENFPDETELKVK